MIGTIIRRVSERFGDDQTPVPVTVEGDSEIVEAIIDETIVGKDDAQRIKFE